MWSTTWFNMVNAQQATETWSPFTNTTAMCWAASTGDISMIEKLLQHGADVNSADYDKRTALHIAVSDNQEEVVEFLLKHGANTNVIDRWGRSPMDYALENKNVRILEQVQDEQTRSRDADKERLMGISNSLLGSQSRPSTDITTLFRAVQQGDPEQIKRVWLSQGLDLNSVDEQGRTSLHVAVENSQLNVIELLLSADVDTAVLDVQGRTPISIALEQQALGVVEMLRAHQKAKELLPLSIQQNQRASIDRLVTDAFKATERGDLEALKRLVPSLVSPNAQDYDLRTLLHIASAEGHVEIAHYLVQCGCEINALDRWGTSPLSEAIDFAHNTVARLLMINHATEAGHRTVLAVEQIGATTLNTALEYALRVVARKRWLMGQVFCPIKEEGDDACVLAAHRVWHRNDHVTDSSTPPPSPSSRVPSCSSESLVRHVDPIQLFRKVASMMLIDPGQGHLGRVYSIQHPEWLYLAHSTANVQQQQLFMLPHLRRAGIQTLVSVPMIYKLNVIGVLSWYSTDAIQEDGEEIQRIQRLLRSIVLLSTLRQELCSVHPPGTSAMMHIPRFQFCQSLENAITANGDLLHPDINADDVSVGDTIPLALEWRLFDFVDRLATSMSSEDHVVIISLLTSLVQLLRTKRIFQDCFEDLKNTSGTDGLILKQCKVHGIQTRWQLLIHLRYYLVYLHEVSPTEGTIFMDVDRLLPSIESVFCGEEIRDSSPIVPSPPSPLPSLADNECILCKYHVAGHIHPGKSMIPPIATISAAPVSSSATNHNYFGHSNPDSPRSPVLLEIESLRSKLENEYDQFDQRVALVEQSMTLTTTSSHFTLSEVYDVIGASHESPAPKRSSADRVDPRLKLLEAINNVMQDTSALITYEQVLTLHSWLLADPTTLQGGGVLRTAAAVGYASPRIYRVFLPVAEITQALQTLFSTINHVEGWISRPLLSAYYAFSVLVFYIHPFQDGNGRLARLVGNIIAKKSGFPILLRAADKTIQLSEFLHKSIVMIEIVRTSRRHNRQTRSLASRKENTSMWF